MIMKLIILYVDFRCFPLMNINLNNTISDMAKLDDYRGS